MVHGYDQDALGTSLVMLLEYASFGAATVSVVLLEAQMPSDII